MDEVIFVDDDFEQLQSLQYSTNTVQSYDLGQQSFHPGGTKRTHNGVIIRQVHQRERPATDFYTSQTAVESATPVPIINSNNEVVDPAQVESVIVDGQDIFFIQEVEDNDSESTGAPLEPHPTGGAQSKLTLPVFDVDSDEEENNISQQGGPSSEQEMLDDYYDVDPVELSDIWNDLITANQEILILLELQDLKHHIVDARQVESQITDVVSNPGMLKVFILFVFFC